MTEKSWEEVLKSHKDFDEIIQGSRISLEDRRKVMEAFTEMVGDVKAHPELNKASREAGMKAIGRAVSYPTIRRWAKDEKNDPRGILCTMLEGALLLRAETYLGMAMKEADEIQDFWEQPNLDAKGNIVLLTRERIMAVKKAQLRIENYRWFASKLAGDVYGDQHRQIKECEEKIKLLIKQVDAIRENK